MGLLDKWNENKFSIYKSEEKTVLKLIDSLSTWFDKTLRQVDENTVLSNNNKNKKVSYDDLHNKYKLTLTDTDSNFDGMWQGLKKPTLSEEGAHAQVEKNMEDIELINTQLEHYANKIGILKGSAIYVGDYKRIGTETDDTGLWKRAIADAKVKKAVIIAEDKLYKISEPLTATGGIKAIVFPYLSYGEGVGGCGFSLSGCGYTALTANCALINVTIHGNGNTVNGILWQNPLLIHGNSVRVYNCNGFGVKINKVWDSVFETISVEKCGNATEYAFSMNDDGDTCNTTHILRLQVEQAKTKAIFISPNTLSCVIDNIHSERAEGDGSNYTWHLGGNRCQYNAIRLSANTGTNAKVLFDGTNTTYISPLIEKEGIIRADINAINGSKLTFIGGDFQPETGDKTNQYGDIVFINTTILNLKTNGGGKNAFIKCKIVKADIGYCTNNVVFDDCVISELAQSSANSKIKTKKSKINSVTSLPNLSIFDDTEITTTTLNVAYKKCYLLNNSKVNGNVNIDFGTLIMNNSTITGDLTQSAGPLQSQFINSIVNGTVSSNLLNPPSGGSWDQGAQYQNLKPSAGGYEGWVCVESGSPGTWKGFGLIQS